MNKWWCDDSMDARKSIILLRKYSKCPKCGSDKIGDGEGTLEMDGDTLKRSCKCGWSVEIKVD